MIRSDISRRRKYSAQKTNPGRLIKKKNAENFFYKPTFDHRDHYTIIRFENNESFDASKLGRKEILANIGQHVAKNLVEKEGSQWKFQAEQSPTGLQYVGYAKKQDIVGVKEGLNKFTGVRGYHVCVCCCLYLSLRRGYVQFD